MAQDVLALMDALEIEASMVGGTSMGGYASLALLRQDPTRVAGLVLMNTQARADDETARAGREVTARRILEEGTRVLLETLSPKLLAPEASPALRAQVEQMILEAAPEAAAAATRGMGLRLDSREILSRYAGPVLVISGEKDAIIPEDRAQEMAGLVSGAQHVRVAGAGHLACLEKPDAVNRAIVEFLRAQL